MHEVEIGRLAGIEDKHWWFRERRHIIKEQVRGMRPGHVLDIGAAAGGNTRVLEAAGWRSTALEYGQPGAEMAKDRGLTVVRGDATSLPIADSSFDLVVAYDVLEHIPDDQAAVDEMHRVLRPGGHALIAVPADPRLWSEHDVAVDHVRRYMRDTLVPLFATDRFVVEDVRSWNVILRPAAAWKRRSSRGSDLDQVARPLNAALGAVVKLERILPVGKLPGVSLMLRARAI